MAFLKNRQHYGHGNIIKSNRVGEVAGIIIKKSNHMRCNVFFFFFPPTCITESHNIVVFFIRFPYAAAAAAQNDTGRGKVLYKGKTCHCTLVYSQKWRGGIRRWFFLYIFLSFLFFSFIHIYKPMILGGFRVRLWRSICLRDITVAVSRLRHVSILFLYYIVQMIHSGTTWFFFFFSGR